MADAPARSLFRRILRNRAVIIMPEKRKPVLDLTVLSGPVLYRGGLLAGIFLAPLLWGQFDALAGALIFAFLCLSAVGRLLTRPARLFPAGLPLATFPLALGGLLLFTGLSYFVSLSRYATTIELTKLASGALLFWLVLQYRVPAPGSIRGGQETKAILNSGKKDKRKAMASPRSPAQIISLLTIVLFLLLTGIGLSSRNWAFYGLEQRLALFSLILLALVFLVLRGRQKADGLPLWETAVAGGGVAATYGVYDWLFMHLIAKNSGWQTFSTFFNPNSLAGFLGITLFLALGGLLAIIARRRTKSAPAILFALALLFMLAAVGGTSSKGSWLSVFLSGLVFIILLIVASAFSRRKKTGLIICLILLALVAPAGLVAARPGLKAKASATLGLQNRSNMFRYLTWQATLHMAKDHPWWGVGAGAFEYGFGGYAIGGYARRAHQNYLETAATTGWPGLFCFVWLMGAALVGVGRAFRRAPREDRLLAAGALSALLVMILHSLVDYDWYIGANQLYFFLAVALGIGVASPSGETSDAISPRRWPSIIAILLLLALAGKALFLGAAENEQSQAEQLSRQERYWEAKDHLETALRLAPNFAEARWNLAAVLAKGLHRYPEAIPLLEQATALEPTQASYWNTLGEVQAGLGRFSEAAKSFRQAGKVNPQFLKPWLNLAEVQLRQKDPAGAVDSWQKILQVEQSPAGRYPAIDYEVKTEYADAHYSLGLAGMKGFAPGGDAPLSHFAQCLKVLDDYQAYGRQLDIQLGSVGRAPAGKEAELNLLRGKCLYRQAQLFEKGGLEAKAITDFAGAGKLVPDIADIIAGEDRLWQK
jgi:O-antigen ligase/Tfp pilus assembly protein PilF